MGLSSSMELVGKVGECWTQRKFCIVFMKNEGRTSSCWLPSVKQKGKGMKAFCRLLDYKEYEYSSREIEQSSSFLLDSNIKEF